MYFLLPLSRSPPSGVTRHYYYCVLFILSLSLIPSYSFTSSVSPPPTCRTSLISCFAHLRLSLPLPRSLSPPLTDSISCGFFTGHLSHSVYGSHGFASASQGKKNSGFWEFSLISWYQCAPLSQSPPPAPLSFSSHVNWTSGGEVTAPPLCGSLTKLEAAREIRFDELWKKKEEGRVRRGCGLLFVL